MADDNLTCRYCPRDDFGNAGARASHERACDENPDNTTQQRERESLPDRQRQQSKQSEMVAADQQENAGAALADIGIALFDDDVQAEQKGQALGGLLGLAQQGVSRYNQYRRVKMEKQENRAKNAELEEVTELPTCECGYQFDSSEIGVNDDRIRCPDCKSLWSVGLKEA